MTHGSLFSGIGGFDLAAQWMGWKNLFHCEQNEFGQKVLKYYWPKAISYHDITQTDFNVHRGQIDILTGGFPCQPYSLAGKRKGKEDSRHLWPEMLRAIREIQPRWVVGENVFGLINWNGGMVFDEVQADLEVAGYEVWPYVLPAVSVNAPHRRDRVWFVAHNSNSRIESLRSERANSIYEPGITSDHAGGAAGSSGKNRKIESNRCENNDEQGSGRTSRKQHNGRSNVLRVAADTNRNDERLLCRQQPEQSLKEHAIISNIGCEELITNADSERQSSEKYRKTQSRWFAETGIPNHWSNWPTQPPVCNGNDGISARLDAITFSKWRNESIKAGGNAVVPQVVHQIFKAIDQYIKANQ